MRVMICAEFDLPRHQKTCRSKCQESIRQTTKLVNGLLSGRAFLIAPSRTLFTVAIAIVEGNR